MRLVAWMALLAAIAPASGSTFRDLDVGIPPGSPLEWDKQLRQPVPTGGRSAIPVATTDQKPEANRAPRSGWTVAEDPKADFGTTNLYDYFRVTTQDIMTHVTFNLPKSTGKVTVEENGIVTGPGGGAFKLTWNYPPEIPAELAWMATMACIRTDIHPEVVSEPEIIAYCVELGVPAYYGARAYEGKIRGIVERWASPLPPHPPALLATKTPLDAMIARLAVVELTSGYAYALDPNFARRTLGLGEDAWRMVAECAHNKHVLLSQNATAVLTNFRSAEVDGELRKILEESTDKVCQFRALSGLLRRHDVSIAPYLLKTMARDKDDTVRCYAFYALGLLGEPAASPVLRDAIANVNARDYDVLWSALPAIARIADKSKENLAAVEAVERGLRGKYKGDDKVIIDPKASPMSPTPTVEAEGSKLKILRQMALWAMAALGHPAAEQEVLQRMEKVGLPSFHPTVWYLAIDVLSRMEGKAVLYVKNVVDSQLDDTVRIHALRALFREEKIDTAYLKERTATGTPVLKAAAIHLLAHKDEAVCAEVCKSIITAYGAGAGAVGGDEAFVVATAAQVGGRINAWGAEGFLDLTKAAERAYSAGAYARRDGENETDITRCKISLYPPLLEQLLIEAGRGGGKKAIGVLLKAVKNAGQPQGRSEAALGLGAVGGKEAVEALLAELGDSDGWLRYCCYQSLKKLTGQDLFTDWIFGPKEVIELHVEKYRSWFRKNQGK